MRKKRAEIFFERYNGRRQVGVQRIQVDPSVNGADVKLAVKLSFTS